MAEEYKVDEMYLCGFPIKEVYKILTIYKETGHANQDYQEGFEDGVKKAYELFHKQLNEQIEKMMRW